MTYIPAGHLCYLLFAGLLASCYLSSVTPLDRNWINCYSIITFVGSGGGVVLVFSFSVTGLLLLSAMSVIGFDY